MIIRLSHALILAMALTAISAVGHAQSSTVASDGQRGHLSHDLSGVWVTKGGRSGAAGLLDPATRPPMTPWGQSRFDATIPSVGPRAIPGKENDPALECYPDGVPKILTSPEPFEIATLPDKVLMLFEKDHGWRQIWTDGRKPPEELVPGYDGYSTGKWEGDTFVVTSIGFNDKIWLDYQGDPRSESLTLTERYQRLDHNTLSLSVTVNDPKAYTKIWVSPAKIYVLKPQWEIMEYYCTPDDAVRFDKDVRIPVATPDKQ